jgi:hypothetical protein
MTTLESRPAAAMVAAQQRVAAEPPALQVAAVPAEAASPACPASADSVTASRTSRASVASLGCPAPAVSAAHPGSPTPAFRARVGNPTTTIQDPTQDRTRRQMIHSVFLT